MRQEQFVLMMSNISASLIAKIAQKQNISDQEALEKLYSSNLYSLLEQEDTKGTLSYKTIHRIVLPTLRLRPHS